MTFCLNTTVIEPDQNNEIKNAVILLHGYGGDGKDISSLAYNWKRFLKNTVFLCPDGYEKCQINPTGYQWFDLNTDNYDYIKKEVIKSETIVKKFIEEVKKKYKLKNSKICLSGFSQGCMLSLNVGLTLKESLACIVGFSGKVIDKVDLSKRLTSKSNILLIHGELDKVVPVSNLLDAKDFFLRNKINIISKITNNCDHHISVEASSDALNFIKQHLNI
tara:strand:+ start:376 stop:1032 length:657 start_codon:yes stop_codon:yes gene_type:complete